MNRVINNRTYDTQTANLIKKCTYGYLGDPAGYEILLFQTPDGLYFQYARGGDASPYPSECIRRVSKAAAEIWPEEK